MTGSLARPAAAGQYPPATPALVPSGYLLAALALLVPAPPALAGWLAGAWVVRCGQVSRGRLAAAGGVTGTLALLIIGPTVAAGHLLGTVAALGAVLPATLTAGAVLEALSAIPVRGVGLAAVTIPAGVVIATIPRRQDPVVRPEWTAKARRRRLRAEARDRRRAERLAQSPRVAASNALGVALDPTPGLPSWRRGRLVVPPAGQLGLTTLLVGAPGTGKTTAAERVAHLCAQERRALCLIDGKGIDSLDEAIAAAVLAAWPEARIAAFPQRPVDLWRASPQQLANRLVAAWQFSDGAEFYEQAAMLGLRLALTAPGRPCGRPPSWSPGSTPAGWSGPGRATRARCR
jgi:hypothetical protein